MKEKCLALWVGIIPCHKIPTTFNTLDLIQCSLVFFFWVRLSRNPVKNPVSLEGTAHFFPRSNDHEIS